ncbi:MAG: ATP-binding cassette domain-containing protein [Endomicrobiaceae bacterium]|nr:ATP-binding cassette domain-containing protein [Endomicrobiaceae bacterium]
MHKPISLINIGLFYQNKVCFENFSAQILYGNRIVIMGNNGSGKSSLINILQSNIAPTSGNIIIPKDIVFGYVPQIPKEYDSLSGGQKFNKSLSHALSLHPDILLLDEPTNHLDINNRKSLIKFLNSFKSTLIIVSHDIELLRQNFDIIWHIDNGKINIFSGKYSDYLDQVTLKRNIIEKELNEIDKNKKEIHKSLMREQHRASQSKMKGEKNVENKRWIKAVANENASNARKTAGSNKTKLFDKKQNLIEQLSTLRIPEIIKPKFNLNANNTGQKTLVNIRDGDVGYKENQNIITGINFSLNTSEHVAVLGNNASGKTTFIKAIMSDDTVLKSGLWEVPVLKDIGYLDQHYNILDTNKSVLQTVSDIVPDLTYADIRNHLNDFLFRKNEEVSASVNILSCGEKVRLVLAKIALQMPKLLILDEITNNIDLETKEHIVEVLKDYNGSMIIVSHDEDFIKTLGITTIFCIENGTLKNKLS